MPEDISGMDDIRDALRAGGGGGPGPEIGRAHV